MKKNKKALVAYVLIAYFTAAVRVNAQGVMGGIANPLPSAYNQASGGGLFIFIGNALKLIGTIAGIYMVIQLVLAGFQYISASGDPKKTEAAWTQIWQSLLGMVIVASAFAIAALVERFTGIKILTPTIYGPGT